MNRLLLVILLIVIALVGCDSESTNGTTSKAQWTQTTVSVVWLQQQEVTETCKRLGVKYIHSDRVTACAAVANHECTIYATQPRSFKDRPALVILGHETWHCFGAMHS